jgi:arylsulfatase A-like enzyme
VPLVIRWPRRTQPGSRSDVPVSGIDFFPTILEVAGVEKPEGKILDGKSLVPLLTANGIFPERPLFWHFPFYLENGNRETRDILFRTRPGSVVRKGDWKLHHYFEDNGFELYNLAEDPGEKQDLSRSHPEKVKELLLILNNWREVINAPVPRESNPEFDLELEKAAMEERLKKIDY